MSDKYGPANTHWLRGYASNFKDKPPIDLNKIGEIFLEAADEIERLAREQDRLQKVVANRNKQIERLRQRIEELEQSILKLAIPLDSDIDPTDCHIITREQIRRAWDYSKGGFSECIAARKTLKILGIKRCEECGGKSTVPRGCVDEGDRELCPTCHGEGWVTEAAEFCPSSPQSADTRQDDAD